LAIENHPMAPTTLRLPNAISEPHLKTVMAKMRKLGAPTIPVVDCGDCYVALDGSHRSIAAAKLGLRVVLDILSPSEVVSADDLGTDFFSGRQKAGWIAEQYRGPHNLVLDISTDGTVAIPEIPKGPIEEE
jgi:hypothetical protein